MTWDFYEYYKQQFEIGIGNLSKKGLPASELTFFNLNKANLFFNQMSAGNRKESVSEN
jgi:hypothetical protein